MMRQVKKKGLYLVYHEFGTFLMQKEKSGNYSSCQSIFNLSEKILFHIILMVHDLKFKFVFSLRAVL